MFGRLVRLLSSGEAFQYPDEIDPSLWKKAVQQDITPENSQSSNDFAVDEEKQGEYSGDFPPQC